LAPNVKNGASREQDYETRLWEWYVYDSCACSMLKLYIKNIITHLWFKRNEKFAISNDFSSILANKGSNNNCLRFFHLEVYDFEKETIYIFKFKPIIAIKCSFSNITLRVWSIDKEIEFSFGCLGFMWAIVFKEGNKHTFLRVLLFPPYRLLACPALLTKIPFVWII